MKRFGAALAILAAFGLTSFATAQDEWWEEDTGTFYNDYQQEGLYGTYDYEEDEWATDEYGYYDTDYDWETDEQWFSDWYGDSDALFENGLF